MDWGAPLVCAGFTSYSPLRYYGLDKPGLHVGVAGLGGLGHVAVKFLKAFGVNVTVIDIAPGKKRYALETLGADQFLLPRELESAKGTLDGILNAVVFSFDPGVLGPVEAGGEVSHGQLAREAA
ncbi:mannitol dehydrogenase [Phtheirospermum japonicum]|uniref:Mannitol dehydrogenase n=1 Tax=Phtheirospermum japonicum TaxID=374723 RepID=A0A830C605_9LAMI|nr:mannitol dehydrogenase [Phtheirospermum japonicum]